MITYDEIVAQFAEDGFNSVELMDGSPTLKGGLAAKYFAVTGKKIEDVFDQQWFKQDLTGAPPTIQVAFRRKGSTVKPFFSDSALWLCQSDNQADHDRFDYTVLITELGQI